MTSQPSYQTLNEITSQPTVWQAVVAEIQRNTNAMRSFFLQQQPQRLVYLGCGSPYFLARSAASMSRALIGMDSEAHPGSDVWLFPEQTLVDASKNLMVVISRSGETTEVMKAIERHREYGGKGVVAVTCYDTSTLASKVDFTLASRDAQEIGVAQTRSFTSMLLMTQGVIHAFADQALSSGFLSLPHYGQRLLEEYSGFAQRFGSEMSTRFNRYFFLGGGARYGLACEIMLKMKEMSLSLSEAYHFMEFRHGPMSMANDETLMVGLVSEAAFAYEAAVLAEMRKKGATVLAITPKKLPAECADHQVILPTGLNDLDRSALYLPILHLIIYAHTMRKGLNPDNLHNLTAVVNLDGVHNSPLT